MKKSFIFAGVTALLIGIAAFAPASLLEGPANRALAGKGELKQLVGTVWSGNGVLALNASGGRIDVPLKWSWAPLSLLRARLGFDVVASGREFAGPARLEAGMASMAIRNAELRASMSAIGRLSRNVGFAKPSGDIELKTGDETVTVGYASPHMMNGTTKVKVSNVRLQGLGLVSLGPLSPMLGSYEGLVTFKDQRIDFKVTNSAGLLALSGGGYVVLGPTREFGYQGVASMLPGSPVWLLSNLGALGKATPDGRVNIDFKTNW